MYVVKKNKRKIKKNKQKGNKQKILVWVILFSSIKGSVVGNCRFFNTFEKNILVAEKKWWSLTYGQAYI
jgi:hypothetical protein